MEWNLLMTTAPFRILQIGLGNRGQMWAEIVGARNDVVLSGVVDVDPVVLREFVGSHPNVPTFTDLATALRLTASDAALLVTPPDGHLAQAKMIFGAGLPLLCEKPLAVDLAQAVAIVQLADSAGLPLTVGLNFRYLPVSLKMREIIAEEVLGRPGFGQFVYQRNRNGDRPGLNKYPLTMEHPMMLEQSIHHLDLIRFCYGREVETVMCHTWNPSWSMYAHESNVQCLLTMADGLEVNYLGTWTGGWDVLQFAWRTDCVDGIILQQELFGGLTIAHKSATELSTIKLPIARPFYDDTALLLDDFILAVRDGRAIPCSGHDHLQTLAVCFAALESSASGCQVTLAEFSERQGLAPKSFPP